MKARIRLVPYLFIIISILGCTEPYALQTDAFEDVIVIEATITNQFKKHEVKISRSYKLEENEPNFENGAIVYVKDNLGNQYNFSQSNDIYISDTNFQAVANRTYQLFVTTQSGKSYSSSPETLTTVSPLQDLEPEVVVKDGVKGVQLVAKSFDPTNSSKYYRFEYEETYKVIAPKWRPVKLIAYFYTTPDQNPRYLELVRRTEEARVCYSTEKNKKILITETSDLSEDRVTFPIRFISNTDYIIMNRYSILVKQYVENLASYTYYQTLKKLSNSENVLSQNQPGFIPSNIKANANKNEKVIGYFSVNSYSEKRVFFNFEDIFPNDALPEYPYYCPDQVPEYETNVFYFDNCYFPPPSDCDGINNLQNIKDRKKVYFSGWERIGVVPDGLFEPPIPTLLLYPIQCGDCTSFSNNIRPTFWID